MHAVEITSFQIKKEMEVNQKGGKPNVVAIITGYIKQHGPLLPLNTDTFILGKILEEIDNLERKDFLFIPLRSTPLLIRSFALLLFTHTLLK